MNQKVSIGALMAQSGVTFGTSGARGLAADITDLVAYAYTKAFLQHLAAQTGSGAQAAAAAIGGDLRPSTGRIMRACAKAACDLGLNPINCGRLPSPALAYYGLERTVPTVMVTGSHIPEDRNGIKYTKLSGEITKADEQGIVEQQVEVPSGLFGSDGMFAVQVPEYPAADEALELYCRRYQAVFSAQAFAGRRIGVYQHSAVGRDVMVQVLRALGADVVPFGRSEVFIPVDTEAIRPEDAALAAQMARDEHFESIVSTDGDSDRPLISDENGKWLRGDMAAILTASFLGAHAAASPVSCNTALEKSGVFRRIIRTRIGSPFVIAGMEELQRQEQNAVVIGYEANGGFLLGSDVVLERGTLKALPTRDAVIVHLSVLSLSAARRQPVSGLVSALPGRYTASNRLKSFAVERSRGVLEQVRGELKSGQVPAVISFVGRSVVHTDETDGMRMELENGEIIHLRPSGNAPEFRCYAEAESEARAEELVERTLAAVSRGK